MNIRDIALHAQGYGIPGVIVDGTDALASLRRRPGGSGPRPPRRRPRLMKPKPTARGGHAEGEEAFLGGQQYRLADELAAARRSDPALIPHTFVVENGRCHSKPWKHSTHEIRPRP
jgi:pyruvate dehydrogenase E1 component alpha subunit